MSIVRSREEMERVSQSAVTAAAQTKKQQPGAIDWGEAHLNDLKWCEQHYNTNIQTGLSSSAYRDMVNDPNWKYNELTPPPSTPWWVKFLQHLTGAFSLLLWVASFASFFAVILDPDQVEYLYLGCVLAFVVVMTATFSFYQDQKADDVMQGFKNMMPDKIEVIRDGKPPETIPARELAVGDVISLFGGKKIPADCRVIKGSNIQVDNSSLTGENLPQDRNAEICNESNQTEAGNILFYGTKMVNGKCTAMCIRTGDKNYMGQIAELVSQTGIVQTPINIEIEHFIHIISYVAIFLGVTFCIIGVFKGIPHVDNLVFGIGIIVANVPEGLLATVTLSLTLTAKRMHLKKVLVKNLEAVETLGSTTVIASDKTGTLTCNRMTVVHLFYDLQFKVAATGNLQSNDASLQELVLCLTICNNAIFSPAASNMALEPKQRGCQGDATESAMIKFAEEMWINSSPASNIMEVRAKHTSLFEIPFNSHNKFALSIHKMDDSDFPAKVFMKGAPERILDRCDYMMDRGQKVLMDPEKKRKISDSIRTLMMQGQRVLACASAQIGPMKEEFFYDAKADEEKQTNFPFNSGTGLCFVGLAALMDPPRAAVPAAVLSCKSAKIQVIMVTGDHPDTAEAIAREVFIINGVTPRKLCDDNKGSPEDIHLYENDPRVTAMVCTGARLASMTDEEVDLLLDSKELVFARTSPAQKLRIVQALQNKKVLRRNGKVTPVRNVVAVTGDGVNDSPALKAADIGIAMGIVGSDVAKDSADMILIDDNFASLVQGVEEGRLIFDNLKKSIAYTLSSNIPEISPFLLFILIQIPLPLPTVLILCIDLGTDMVPAIALAYENKEANIMQKAPRDMNVDRLVTAKLVVFSYLQIGLFQAVAGFYCYFVVLNDYGFDPSILPWLAPNFNSEHIFHEGDNTYIQGVKNEKLWLKPCNIQMEGVCHVPEEALAHAQCAFFISIIVVQWADLVCCKTRELSLVDQGLRNGWLNFGLAWETGLGAFLCYVTALNLPLGTRPIHYLHWVPAMPFCAVILCYDEARKYLMRSLEKNNWFFRNTYY